MLSWLLRAGTDALFRAVTIEEVDVEASGQVPQRRVGGLCQGGGRPTGSAARSGAIPDSARTSSPAARWMLAWGEHGGLGQGSASGSSRSGQRHLPNSAGRGRRRRRGSHRAPVQRRSRGPRTVEAAVRDHGASQGALQPAVVRVQVHHERSPDTPQRPREALGRAVRVAGVTVHGDPHDGAQLETHPVRCADPDGRRSSRVELNDVSLGVHPATGLCR